MKLYLGKNDEVSNLEELLRKLPDNTFASPRRSTLPLLDFWRTPESRLKDLSRSLGLATLGDATLSFEYPVDVRAGRGKASFTDLMIMASNVAIAIEAKHREPLSANMSETPIFPEFSVRG